MFFNQANSFIIFVNVFQHYYNRIVLLYYKDTLFGGIYDDRFLVKRVETNKKYNMEEVIPYDKGKPMYLVDDIDNMDTLKEIVLDTYEGLKK